MIKKKEVPPFTVAELISKVTTTPDTNSEIIVGLDKHKAKMAAVVLQSKRTFKVRTKKKNGKNQKQQTGQRSGRSTKTAHTK